MRKFSFVIVLFFLFTSNGFSQDPDQIAQRKVDSLKKLLPSVKGITRIDMLNSMARGLLFIWESDDQYLHDAMKYADEALKLATKLNYKRGKAYAMLNLFYQEGHRADTNKVENNKQGSYFQKAVKTANDAIKIGEELQDNILIGTAYEGLKWLYRWKGKREDYITQMQKSIHHYEKALKQNWANIYTPLKLTDCENCTGVEFHLGSLYGQLADAQVLFKDETIQKLRQSIAYYEKAGANSSAGNTYLRLADVLARFNDIRTAVAEAKKALPYYVKENDDDGIFNVCQILCGLYYELGDLENGLLYSKKAVRFAERLATAKGTKNDLNYPGDNEFLKERRLFQAYNWIGRFYTLGSDYDNALLYIQKAAGHNYDKRWWDTWSVSISNLYRVQGKYDSALHNLDTKRAKISIMRLYNDMKQYDKTIQIFNEIVDIVTQRNNLANLGRIHAFAAGAYYGKRDFKQALTYARKADDLFKITSSNLDRIDNYQLLSDIYHQVGKFDSAYIFLKQYNSLRDSVLNKQFYIRLNDFKREAEEEKRTGQIKLLEKDNLIKEQLLQQQILLQQKSDAQLTLLNKDNEIKNQQLLIKDQELQINGQTLKEQALLKDQQRSQLTLLDKDNKLKDQQLKQQMFVRNALLAGLFLLLLLGVFVFRWLSLKQKNERLRSEKKQAELQQQSTDLEMQALRAQMNPHFIFNCLSSINKFILKNESRSASDYLTRFSRLIRKVLTNSQLSMIPLSDEIETLKLYLDMERLRFDNAFDYNIIYANTIEPETLYIPPMLLQPFCENAIWHGLMHKEGQGKLQLEMRTENNQLYCTIIDNGIGREKAAVLKSKSGEKQKSYGLKITTERLALFNNDKLSQSYYYSEDVLDEQSNIAGTSVHLVIKYKDAVQELVNA